MDISQVQNYLIQHGMNRNFVKSPKMDKALELVAEIFGDEEKRNANEMLEKRVDEKTVALKFFDQEIEEKKKQLGALAERENELDGVLTERSLEVLALYNKLIQSGMSYRADPDVAVKNAGFIVYAFLGGKAKTIVNTDSDDDYDYE